MDSNLVDIFIHSGNPGSRHPLATGFPISILASISKRFKEDFESGNVDAVNAGSRTGCTWTIYDPNAVLSTKAMKIIFIWLCGVGDPTHLETFERVPINVGAENWGIVGVAAAYGALCYLGLQGPLANQNHLRRYILDFCKAQKNFVWDEIVLAWWYLPDKDIMEHALEKAVCKYLENHDKEDTRGSRFEYAAFMKAIDSYHGRAESLRKACGSVLELKEPTEAAKYRSRSLARRRQSPVHRRRHRLLPTKPSRSSETTPATAVNAIPMAARRGFKK